MSSTSDPAAQINQLPISLEMPEDFDQFREITSLLFKRIVDAVNKKEGSLYVPQELGNFQLYFTTGQPFVFRNVYRKVFDMVFLNGGPIAPGATVSALHHITTIVQSTHIYGSATNSDTPVKFIPLPFVNPVTTTDQVEIYLTPTDVVLINGSTQSVLTSATIVAEFCKN